MNPATQPSHRERSHTPLDSSECRPAAGCDSSDPRSSAPTLAVPRTSEIARSIDRVQEQIEREDSGSPISIRVIPDNRPRPEWCVDLGSMLKPMTTFELWIAIANGSVSPETRVWRDGMDRWRKVRTIAELAHVLPDAPASGSAANDATGTPPPTVRERSLSELTPFTRLRVTAETELDLDRHPSEPRPSMRTAPYRSGFFSVAIGATVGFGALLLALISTQGIHLPGTSAALSPTARQATQGVSAYGRVLTARAQEWAAGAEGDLELSGQELDSTEPDGHAHRSSASARRRDPGQSRARRGSRP